VTKAARLLGVHPNTIRAWSDQGRLRYYGSTRGADRRYRLGDLQWFLAAAEAPAGVSAMHHPDGRSSAAIHGEPGAGIGPGTGGGRSRRDGGSGLGGPLDTAIAPPRPARRRGDRLSRGGAAAIEATLVDQAAERRTLDLRVLAELAALTAGGRDLDHMHAAAATLVLDAYGFHLVAAYEQRDDQLVLRASAPSPRRPTDLPIGFGTAGGALDADRPLLVRADSPGWQPLVPGSAAEIAVPILAGTARWGVFVVASHRVDRLTLSVQAEDRLEDVAVRGLVEVGRVDAPSRSTDSTPCAGWPATSAGASISSRC
jgi:hypothetical protein